MTDTNLNEALETVRVALEVNLSLWRDDVEPGDFDRDVIEPTQRALAALSQIEARLGEYDAAWEKWADHSLRRHECDWGYTERPGASFATTTEELEPAYERQGGMQPTGLTAELYPRTTTEDSE